MPFDPKKFLASLDLNESERQAAEAIFGKEKNIAELNRGYSARDEASRLMDEGTAAKTEAETIRAAATAEKAEAERIKAEAATLDEKNKTWHKALTDYESTAQQTEAERNALAAEKAALLANNTAYEAYLRSIDLDPAVALGGRQPINPGVVVPPPTKVDPPAPVFDEKAFQELLAKQGYVKQSDLQPAAQLMVNLPFELQEVQQRHFDLFGKPAPVAQLKELQSKYLNPQNNRPLLDIAAEDFHFADRQKEIDEADLSARAETMAKEMFEKRLSELHLPAAQIDQLQNNPSANVRFTSDDFAKNGTRAGELSQDKISDKDMDAFLALDTALAAQGIRPA